MRTFSELSYIPTALILGQSNGSGRGFKANIVSPTYLEDAKGSIIWNENALELITPEAYGVAGNVFPFDSVPNALTQHGMEVSMIRAWEREYDGPMCLFKYALSGLPLLVGSSATLGVWDPAENEVMHGCRREWKEMVKALVATYNKPVKAEYLVWCQGETDSSSLASQPGAYKAALYRLLNAIREMTGNPDLKIILVMPSSYSNDSIASVSNSINLVRYEQIEVAVEDNQVGVASCFMPDFYSTAINSFTHDDVHYTSEVQVDNGKRVHQVYRALYSGESAPSAVTGLTATPNETYVDLSWTGNGSREYIVMRGSNVVGTTTGTTIQIDGLSAATGYTFDVLSHATDWQTASASVSTTTTGSAPSFDMESDLITAGYTELEIQDLLLKTEGGSYGSTARQTLSDPDYTNNVHVTTAPYTAFRNSLGFTTYKLADFAAANPVSGELDDLRSEIPVATKRDSSGKFIFYGTHKSFQHFPVEIDTITRTPTFLGEKSTSNLNTDYHHTIMPHPTEDDTILYIRDKDATTDQVMKFNLRTGVETHQYDLGFIPALKLGKGDANGIFDGRIVCNETEGPHKCFILDYATGQAVNTVNGVSTLVPIANRQTVTILATNSSDLDHVYTDGKYMYAVIKNNAGFDNDTGTYIYDSTGPIERITASTKNHAAHLRAELGGTSATTIVYKLNPGAATELGGSYTEGDMVVCKMDISYSTQYDITYTHAMLIPNSDGINGNALGGQWSGISTIDNYAMVSMTTAHTSSSGRGDNTNYIDSTFFGKEEIFLFDLSGATPTYRRIGKNLTRLLNTTSAQTEINIIGIGQDGTIYAVVYGYVGPPKLSTAYVLADKTAWLIVISPEMAAARKDYYLALS